ncbi:MAG: FecR family protein, partial [Endomicrobiales bacterium]
MAACALFLCTGLLFSGIAHASAEFCSELSGIKGTVEVQRKGDAVWSPAAEGMGILPSDRLKTLERSSCNLELDDGSVVFIDENTEASVDVLELTRKKHTSGISLWFGKLLAKVTPSSNTKMRVRTPTMTAAVRGTEFAVEASGEKTAVGVFEGSVA